MKKKNFLRRSNLYGIILALAALTVSLCVEGAPSGQAPKSPDKAARHAALTAKYGLTPAQLQQYDALEAVRLKKVAEIKETPGLLSQERRTRIREAVREFQSSLDKILTPQQLAAMKSERGKNTDRASKVNPIKKEYRKERTGIKSKKTAQPNQDEALAQLNKKYESRLSAAVGQERAQKVMKQLTREHNFDRKMKTRYGLTQQQLQQYNALQAARHKKAEEIKKTPGLLSPERRTRIKNVTQEFQSSLAKILTPQQLAAMKGKRDKGDKRDKDADRNLKNSAKKEYRKERAVIKSKKTALPNPDEALAQLNKKYESRLSAVGPNKAQKITEKLTRERNFDQKMTKRYGFSAQQLKQYKDIQNQQAVEKLKIRKGTASNEEKQAKVKELKAQTEKKLAQVLTAQQRSQMAAQKQKAKEGGKKKVVKAHKKKAQK